MVRTAGGNRRAVRVHRNLHAGLGGLVVRAVAIPVQAGGAALIPEGFHRRDGLARGLMKAKGVPDLNLRMLEFAGVDRRRRVARTTEVSALQARAGLMRTGHRRIPWQIAPGDAATDAVVRTRKLNGLGRRGLAAVEMPKRVADGNHVLGQVH